MPTLNTYWKEIDDISFKMLQETMSFMFTFNMAKIYEGDEYYINKVKKFYNVNLFIPMYKSMRIGNDFYMDMTKSIGKRPIRLSRKDLGLIYNRSLSITKDYINNAIDDFANEIRALTKNMRFLGMSKSSIVNYLFNEKERNRPIFNRFNNRMKKILDDGIDRAAAYAYNEGIRKSYNLTKDLFDWISVGDGRVCPDCRSRHKRSLYYKEWLKIGVPRGGFTFCLLSCRCILLPNDYVDDELDLTKPVTRMKVVIKDGKPIKQR